MHRTPPGIRDHDAPLPDAIAELETIISRHLGKDFGASAGGPAVRETLAEVVRGGGDADFVLYCLATLNHPAPRPPESFGAPDVRKGIDGIQLASRIIRAHYKAFLRPLPEALLGQLEAAERELQAIATDPAPPHGVFEAGVDTSVEGGRPPTLENLAAVAMVLRLHLLRRTGQSHWNWIVRLIRVATPHSGCTLRSLNKLCRTHVARYAAIRSQRELRQIDAQSIEEIGVTPFGWTLAKWEMALASGCALARSWAYPGGDTVDINAELAKLQEVRVPPRSRPRHPITEERSTKNPPAEGQ